VAANSQNYLAHYYYAFTLSRSSPNPNGFAPDVAAKIREHLQKAIALRPDFPEPYSLLAFVSVITGQGLDEAIASMKRVLSISPGRHDFINMLAQLYMRKEDFKAARPLLEQVVKSNASEEDRNHAQQLLDGIGTYEKAMAEIQEARKRGQDVRTELVTVGTGPDAAQSAPQQPPDPSTYLREVLRAPKAGETQLQATLVKIECGAKGIVFVVRSGTQLLRLVTKTFEDIEITTYDPKSGSEITCGPRKPENTVVVCYVPNTNVLKSVEFVPADFKLKP
jgi:tetratricopeptide (TPR) repeat protein